MEKILNIILIFLSITIKISTSYPNISLNIYYESNSTLIDTTTLNFSHYIKFSKYIKHKEFLPKYNFLSIDNKSNYESVLDRLNTRKIKDYNNKYNIKYIFLFKSLSLLLNDNIEIDKKSNIIILPKKNYIHDFDGKLIYLIDLKKFIFFIDEEKFKKLLIYESSKKILIYGKLFIPQDISKSLKYKDKDISFEIIFKFFQLSYFIFSFICLEFQIDIVQKKRILHINKLS